LPVGRGNYFFCYRAEQFNGREGETAAFFGRCPLNYSRLGGGFAPLIPAVSPLRFKIKLD